MLCLLQLPHPTPTVFTFPSQASTDTAPSLSIFSPGGTGRSVSPGLTPPPNAGNPQPSPLSPSRGYCPAMRGLVPTSTAATGLSVLTAPVAARSPSVNRLGSLFDSINRSVTSAFSNFVAVNQPVPGVIQDYDRSTPPQRHQLQPQPSFEAPSRRGSANQDTTPKMAVATSTSVPQNYSPAPGSSGSSTQGRSGCQPPRAAVPMASAAGEEGVDGRVVPVRARPPPLQRAPVPRRPRAGLPIHDASNTAPSYADEPSHRNFSQRGTSV